MSGIIINFKDEKQWRMQLLGVEVIEVREDGTAVVRIDKTDDGQISIKAENYLLQRVDKKFYYSTLRKVVAGDIVFYQPFFFESNAGNPEKIADVIIVLRKNPNTHRWMVQIDQEEVFEDEVIAKNVWRTLRSSLDNVVQSVGRRIVNNVGWIYSNPRRIGGKPIQVHYVIAGWAPQKEVVERMMDVFQYVQTTDAMGQATLLKALVHMADKTAKEILGQLHKAPEDQEQ